MARFKGDPAKHPTIKQRFAEDIVKKKARAAHGLPLSVPAAVHV